MSTLQLFGQKYIQLGSKAGDVDYRVIVVNLEWNLIFLIGEDKKLIAYDMNLKKVLVFPAHVVLYPRSTWRLRLEGSHYLPYVPLFMESVGEQ